MSPIDQAERDAGDAAPGDEGINEREFAGGVTGYVIGLVLAALLTAGSFLIANTTLIWPPAIPMALVVLAVAQIGIHLVFFLHVTSGPDNTNNILALAFGVLIVALTIFGSIWIMAHLDHHDARMVPGMDHH